MTRVGTILKLVAAVLGGVLLARGLHATEAGHWILRRVPDGAWAALHKRLGLEGAETTAEAETLVWLVACLGFSLALVFGGGALLRRCRRRRSRPPRAPSG